MTSLQTGLKQLRESHAWQQLTDLVKHHDAASKSTTMRLVVPMCPNGFVPVKLSQLIKAIQYDPTRLAPPPQVIVIGSSVEKGEDSKDDDDVGNDTGAGTTSAAAEDLDFDEDDEDAISMGEDLLSGGGDVGGVDPIMFINPNTLGDKDV